MRTILAIALFASLTGCKSTDQEVPAPSAAPVAAAAPTFESFITVDSSR